MGYNEHLGIILMRDNGPRCSFRISRRLFYALAVFFACLPLVCAGLAWYGYTQFQKNSVLASLLEQRNSELDVARASAKRLENLNVLLQENTLEGREQILHRLAMAEEAKARVSQNVSIQKTGQDTNQPTGKSATQAESKAVAQVAGKPETDIKQAGQTDKAQARTDDAGSQASGNTDKAADKGSGKAEIADSGQIASGQSGQQTQLGQENSSDKAEQVAGKQGPSAGNRDEGPGHEDFQEIDEHFVRVSNVQARAFTGNRLRIAIDLHNTEKQEQAVGTIRTTLLTDSGNRHQVVYEQKDAGDFKINRFKRAVMLSKIPREFRLANSQIQIEVFMQDGNLVYRNIYSVER